jgi:hypothetical protein
VLVQISGVGVCSGTPITGTPFVVTAAHCVLDHDGNVVSGTVIRGGVGYHVAAVLVDVRYHETPVAALDAAVLVVDRPIPGPSASLGTALPVTGLVTLAGFQPLDRDGTLLRGTNPHNLPLPTAARGEAGVVRIDTAPAGCEIDIASVDATRAWVNVPCGLIPGASGGGLFATDGDSFELVGILSWVSADITHNGVVPIDSLLELLEHQADYLHVPTPDTHSASTAHVIHS